MRNLDTTTLRSFVAVADAGGVTRAASSLNLTQSAVSMQLKRLEETLGIELIDRAGRRVALTGAGEQLLGYARRIVALNDEVVARLTDSAFEGEVVLGVPHDVVYPVIPQVLQRFAAACPRVKVHLITSFTRQLKQDFANGACDLILTTEPGCDEGGETLIEAPLAWFGAPGGAIWRQRPLRLAVGRQCIFHDLAVAALNEAGIPWDVAVETDSDRTIEATVSADLAVHAMLDGHAPAHLERIAHGGTLPDLPVQRVNLYCANRARNKLAGELAVLLRQGFLSLPGSTLPTAAE